MQDEIRNCVKRQQLLEHMLAEGREQEETKFLGQSLEGGIGRSEESRRRSAFERPLVIFLRYITPIEILGQVDTLNGGSLNDI